MFKMNPVFKKDGEMGLSQILFANLDEYPLKAFNFTKWQSVNSLDDMIVAEDFVWQISNL